MRLLPRRRLPRQRSARLPSGCWPGPHDKCANLLGETLEQVMCEVGGGIDKLRDQHSALVKKIDVLGSDLPGGTALPVVPP